MRRVLLLSIPLLLSAAVAVAQDKPRVAVFSMEFATVKTDADAAFGASVDVGKGLADLVVDALVRSGAVDVYEREEFEKIVSEQDATNSSRFDPATAAKIGRNAGVQAVVIGSITKFGQHERKIAVYKATDADVELTARVIDTSTGKILFTVKGAGTERRKGISVADIARFVPVVGNASSKISAVVPLAGAVIPMKDWVGKDFKGTLIGTVMAKAAEQAAADLVRQREAIAATPPPPDTAGSASAPSVSAPPMPAAVAPLTGQVLVELIQNHVPDPQVVEIVNSHQNFAISPLEPSWALIVAANKIPLAVQNAVRARANLPPLRPAPAAKGR